MHPPSPQLAPHRTMILSTHEPSHQVHLLLLSFSHTHTTTTKRPFFLLLLLSAHEPPYQVHGLYVQQASLSVHHQTGSSVSNRIFFCLFACFFVFFVKAHFALFQKTSDLVWAGSPKLNATMLMS